ncbi:unnamed protein product [Phyllotreta striolata]|uniref:Doublecortin domain-containing protein n=1 Tax=Phyllotreta striolata TaxID=444603 RepID=A0A9P0GTU8_PHYSR|nr:unnamed protein product [Phyllotreta striolata]
MKYKRIRQVPLPEPYFGKTKKIKIWENGESKCYVFNINPKDLRNWGLILNHITNVIRPSFGAVKHLIELSTLKEVKSFEELDSKQKYIATGANEKIREPIKGYKTHAEMLKDEKEANRRSPIYPESGRVTHNWEFLKQTEKLKNTVIYVALNGSTASPQKAVFKENEIEDFTLIRNYFGKILGMSEEIAYFCTVYGRIIQDPKDFQHGYLYVAVPFNEAFVEMDYVGLFKKCYKYRKNRKSKIISAIGRPYSSPYNKKSIDAKKVEKKKKTEKKKKPEKKTKSETKKCANINTANQDITNVETNLMKNEMTGIDSLDSTMKSELELRVTYYSPSEEAHKPSYKCPNKICNNVNNKKLKNVSPKSTKDEPSSDESTATIVAENKETKDTTTNKETSATEDHEEKKPSNEQGEPKKGDSKNESHEQGNELLVYKVCCNEGEEDTCKATIDNQLISYPEPPVFSAAIPNINELKKKHLKDIIFPNNTANTKNALSEHLIYEINSKSASQRDPNDLITEIMGIDEGSHREIYDNIYDENDNLIRSQSDCSVYIKKVVDEGCQTLRTNVVYSSASTQFGRKPQETNIKPFNRPRYVRSLTEPSMTLSQQIMNADSTLVISNPSKKSKFILKSDIHDSRRNKKSNIRHNGCLDVKSQEDDCSNKPKFSLDQSILRLSQALKSYQKALISIERNKRADEKSGKLFDERSKDKDDVICTTNSEIGL